MRVQNERIFLKYGVDGWDYIVSYEDEFGIVITDQGGYGKTETKDEALAAAKAYVEGLKRYNYVSEWVEVTDDEM